MLDTSVDSSEESCGSSASVGSGQHDASESLSPLSKQARPETLQALRSLSCKYAETRGPSLFDRMNAKAARSATVTTDQQRPPLLKLASSGMTMGGDDRSTASSLQEKQQQPPPLEDWAAILQLGYLMLGPHRGRAEEIDTAAASSEPVDLVTGKSDARESACKGAELPDQEEEVMQDDDKTATPYPACVGALGMIVAAGMLVAAHDYFSLLDVPSVPNPSFANSTESFWMPSTEALSERHHSIPVCVPEEAVLHDNANTAIDHVPESLTDLFSRDVLYPLTEQCWWDDDGNTLVVDGADGGDKGEGTTIPAALVSPLVFADLLDEEFPCPPFEEDDNEVDRDNEEAFTTPQSPSSASRTENKQRRFRPWRAFHRDSLLRKIIDRLMDGGPKQRHRRRTWGPENMVDDWLKVVTYHFEESRRR